MSPITEFMDILVETAEKNCMLESEISLKELKAEGGLYAEPGKGFTESRYYDKTEVKEIPVLFLCRNADQRKCMEQLESICNFLQRLKVYPSGTMFSWLNTEIVEEPAKIGRDEDGVYHYSAVIRCKLFY